MREMEKMLVILSEILSYQTENFKWRNSGPYQIGHNKRLVILSVVISGAYCIAFSFMFHCMILVDCIF